MFQNFGKTPKFIKKFSKKEQLHSIGDVRDERKKEKFQQIPEEERTKLLEVIRGQSLCECNSSQLISVLNF